jgi:uncharacterized phage protein (TIGR01671 family)
MIRELKCRAWNGHKNEWYDPELIRVSLDFSLIGLWCGPDRGYIFEDTTSWKVTIQQYTGLKDKNGKEIYEGDIVSGKFYDTDYMSDVLVTCPVKWIEQSASFNIGHHYWTRASIKIIGNIFENPELLENEKGNQI